MAELIAVEGDENTDGGGGLKPSQTSVFINGKPIIVDGDGAFADKLCPTGAPHCNPSAADGAEKVYVNGKGVHLNKMSRSCGASTIVSGQTNVWVGEFVGVTVLPQDLAVDPIPLHISLNQPITPPYIFDNT